MLIPALLVFKPAAHPNNLLVLSALKLVPLPYFVFLATIGVRSVLATSVGRAALSIVAASCSLLLLPVLPNLFLIFSSPFLLIILIILLRNFLGDALATQRNRESFRQNLHASTLNPADASAHYNLGLIYQQRRQYDEAKSRFAKAVEIDPEEVDAHYQLGRIAREEGRYADAISHFDAVVQRSPHHCQNEVWREIARAYNDAGQCEDAVAAFERFLEKRSADPEGLYRYGLALQKLGRHEHAVAQMQACIHAVHTLPAYKLKTERRWLNEAEAFLRTAAAARH
jgi:tetratricopeptide (TPR) repeat protein